MEKKYFYTVYGGEMAPVFECDYCKDNIVFEEQEAYMNFGYMIDCNTELEYGKTKEEIEEILNDGDLYDIKKLDNEYYENTCICDKCYNSIGKENPVAYEKLLDMIFKGYPKQSETYRRNMSYYFPNVGSHSTVALNNIINAIHTYDYYEICIKDLSLLDKNNYEFAIDILYRFAGIDIELMKQKNKEKNIALGRHVY